MKDEQKTGERLADETVKLCQAEFRQAREVFTDVNGYILPPYPGDAVILADIKGNFLEANDNALELLGYTREELLNMNPSLIHPREEIERAVDNFAEAVAGRSSSLYDIKMLRKDGKVVPVDMTGGIVRYRGKLLVLGVFRDITGRKLMEKALFESEDRFRRLAENARDLVYRMSLPDGKYEYVSPSSYDIVGYTPEEHYHGDMRLEEVIHPDFAEYFNQQWENLLKGEAPPCYEFKIIHKDGGERWLYQTNALVRDDNGRPVAIEGIVTDITDRKTLEEELKARRDRLEESVTKRTSEIQEEVARRKAKEEQYLSLVESIVEWVWETDENFVHTYLSPRIYDVLGYRPEELIGKSPVDIMPPGEVKRASPLIGKIFSRRERFVSFENLCFHKDGRLISIEANGTPFFDEQGKLLGYRGSCHDITELKKTLNALKEREEELTIKSDTLEEVNAALRILLKQREQDREEVEEKFVLNIKQMVFPYIQKMKKYSLDPRQKTYLDIIEANLDDIISPFLNTIRHLDFTPKEAEVATHVREGRVTKEIAEIMGVAPSAIDSHRDNIRKKLGINKQKMNLRTYLLSLK